MNKDGTLMHIGEWSLIILVFGIISPIIFVFVTTPRLIANQVTTVTKLIRNDSLSQFILMVTLVLLVLNLIQIFYEDSRLPYQTRKILFLISIYFGLSSHCVINTSKGKPIFIGILLTASIMGTAFLTL